MSDTEKKVIKVEDIKKTAEAEDCTVKKAMYYIREFLAEPMCGRCFPCSMGSYEAKLLLEKIAKGKGVPADIERLNRISGHMAVASLCKKGKDTAAYLKEWLDTGHLNSHIEGFCPNKVCCAFVEYRVIPEKCNLCGECKKVCEYDAIHGEKKQKFMSGFLPYEIRQHKCTKCGQCITACPTGAIVLVAVKECAAAGK